MTAGQRYGVEVRAAVAADAPELGRLLGQAGIAITPADAAARLDTIRTGPDATVLVATGYGGLSGLVAVHWAPALHVPHPLATVSALIVDVEERRRGIGRLLLKAACQAARAAGCDTLRMAGGDAFCAATGFITVGAVSERALRRRGRE